MGYAFQIRVLEEFNEWLGQREQRRCPCPDVVYKLRHLGWAPWKYVLVDDSSEQLRFFETKMEMEQWIQGKPMRRCACGAPQRYWRLADLVWKLRDYVKSLN